MNAQNVKFLFVGLVVSALTMACTPRHNEWKTKKAKANDPQLTENKAEEGETAQTGEVSEEGAIIPSPQIPVRISGVVIPRSTETPCENFRTDQNLAVLLDDIKACFIATQEAAVETSVKTDGVLPPLEAAVTAAYADVLRDNSVLESLGVAPLISIRLNNISSNATMLEFTMDNAINVGPSEGNDELQMSTDGTRVLVPSNKAHVSDEVLDANPDEKVLVLVPGSTVLLAGISQEHYQIRVIDNSLFKIMRSDPRSETVSQWVLKESALAGIIVTKRINGDVDAQNIRSTGSVQSGIEGGADSTLDVTQILWANISLDQSSEEPLDSESLEIGGTVNYVLTVDGLILPLVDEIERREGLGQLKSFVYYTNLSNPNVQDDRKLGRHPVSFKGQRIGQLTDIEIKENKDIQIKVGLSGDNNFDPDINSILNIDLKRN